jgi:photosystem II stability/assembly factor-like uncharacterized protein
MIYVSTDGGSSWSATSAPVDPWTCLASSADGGRLIAANAGLGDNFIYISTDSGATWNPTTAPSNQWASVASSTNGSRLIAADSGNGDGLIYVSTDSGQSWTPTAAPVEYWTAVACSADGSILTATADPGGIYTWQSIPILNLVQSGGNVLISWPDLSSANGFVLQENSDLTTASWAPAPNAPALVSGMNQVTIPISPTGSYFFRLVGP